LVINRKIYLKHVCYKKGAIQRLFLCPGMDGMTQGAREAIRLCTGIHASTRSRLKAAAFSLLLPCMIAASGPSLADSACPATAFDASNRVSYVHDGDTLHLKNRQKVRLIGINTPELRRGKKPAEAFSDEAKSALKSLLKNNQSVSLLYGIETHDHYQRLLAHAFTNDGQNIQALLLANGFARSIVIPPNTRYANCYREQERKARCHKKGLWKNAENLQAKSLRPSNTGFQLIEGQLIGMHTNKKGIWLNLDDQLTVAIRPDNQSLFDIDNIHSMLNKKIVVRGWLNKSNKHRPFYMRIKHPLSIQLASDFRCQ
jgi:micrococcal nuclease